MIKFSLSQAAAILSITPPASDTTFTGLSIDTRTLAPGNLFVALQGEHTDGHEFLAAAKEKGAAAALVQRVMAIDLPQLVVTDTVFALGKLGAAWRDQFNLPIIAITGSNGKTTLKNMVASILKAACGNDESKVLATLGTLNNHLGLPLTLGRLNPQHRYAVLEMGMNHFGEIDYLTRLARPNVALITNAAASHLEGVGDVAGVAQAKGEIFNGLTAQGTAILNRDDEYYAYWRKQVGQRPVISFGFHPEADVTLSSAPTAEPLNIRTPKGNLSIKLPLLGQHNILNALAAIATTLAINIDFTAIQFGIENMQAAPGRLEMHVLENGVKIIDDTYNANPFSLQAAVHTLATYQGKKILVLGDMKELGQNAEQLHFHAGVSIREAGINYLFTLGDLSENTAHAFGEGAYHFKEQAKLLAALKPFLYNQTTILIKGSRSMRMEKVVQSLIT